MKILITGGAGFIGSNFLYYWLNKYPSDKICVIDALTYAGNYETLKPVRKKIDFIKADINDRPKVKRAMKGIDVVVHFAAESHVERSIFDPSEFWRTNVNGTRVLLEEADKAKVRRFHHVSTDEVYGELPLDSKERFSEKTPYAPRPDNLYAISKAEADRVVREFGEDSDMYITISNCSNNYGPYQFPEKYIPIIVTNLIDGYKAPIHGDGKNVRDWIHTEDHAKAIDLIIAKGKHGETYLIGSENDVPNKLIAEKVVKLYGKDESWLKYVPDRHSNDRRYAINPKKIQKELGWKPTITKENFDDGLTETIDWFKKNESWWRPLLRRKANISSKNANIYAFITLDREAGKVKFAYKNVAVEETGEQEPVFVEKLMDNKGMLKVIEERLDSKKWYKNSDSKIKKQLKSLLNNPSTQGFVEDLANRPDKIGSVKQKKLIKLSHAPQKYGIYGIGAWFLVETKTGAKKVEGYYSWATGPKSGAKLLILLKQKKKITHLIFLKDEKFAVGEKVYDLAGGFPQINESVFEMIARQLKSEVGIDGDKKMKVEEIIGLGRIAPDAGMTNNHPFIYAVVVEASKWMNLPPGKIKETKKGVVYWPVDKLSEIVNKVDDSYFLSALARLTLGGVGDIKLS